MTTDLRVASVERGRSRLLEAAMRHPVLTIAGLSFVARAAVAVVVAVAFGGTLFGDDVTYHQLAQMFAEGETDSWTERDFWLYRNVGGFTFPLTALYWLLGSTPIVGQLFAAVLGSTVGVAICFLARKVASEGLALAAGLVVGLLPSQVLFSGLILKDPETWAILATVALLASSVMTDADASRRRWLAALGGIAVLLLLLGFVRFHTQVVAVWAFVIAAVWGSTVRRRGNVAGAALIALIVPWLTGLGPGGVTFVLDKGKMVDEQRDYGALAAATAVVPDPLAPQAEDEPAKEDAGAGGGEERGGGEEPGVIAAPQPGSSSLAYSDQFLNWARSSPPLVHRAYSDQFLAHDVVNPQTSPVRLYGSDQPLADNLLHLPRGIAVVLLEPFPWREGNLRTDLARAETLVWYPLLLLGLFGVRRMLRHPSVGVFALAVSGGLVLIMALTEGNYGTAYRHRGEIVWAVGLASVFGFQQLQDWYVRLRAGRQRA